MTIYLIRHGETDWNAEKRIQGRTDIPLNAAGRRQAEALARAFYKNPRGVAAVYASKLLRADETGRVIAASLGVPFYSKNGLEELGFGSFEGKTFSEAQTENPTAYERVISGGLDARAPQGESRREMLLRVLTALVDIMEETRGNVAVVSHGAVIRHLTNYASLNSCRGESDFAMGNGEIYELTDETVREALRRLNREAAVG